MEKKDLKERVSRASKNKVSYLTFLVDMMEIRTVSLKFSIRQKNKVSYNHYFIDTIKTST